MACECEEGESCAACTDSEEEPNSPHSSDGETTNNKIREPIHLAYGMKEPERMKRKVIRDGVVRFEWDKVIEKREDSRILPHPIYPPTRVYPISINLENEIESIERARVSRLGDLRMLDRADFLLPNNPIHQTILLNSMYHFDPARDPDSRCKKKINYGNCLATLDLATVDKYGKSFCASHVLWRSGDSDGRGTAISHGHFAHKHVKPRGNLVNRNEKPVDFELEKLPPNLPLFRPTPPATFSLSTSISPLLQIQLAPVQDSHHGLLAFRSSTSVTLSEIEFCEPGLRTNLPSVVSTYDYFGKDFDGKPIADIALGGIQGGNRGSGLLIDVRGGLFGFGLTELASRRVVGLGYDGRKPEMFRLRKAMRKDLNYSGFARVAWGGSRGMDAVVGFEDEVLVFDIRSPNASLTLIDSKAMKTFKPPLHPLISNPILTSLTQSSSWTPFRAFSDVTFTPTPYHTVCTTKDVIWLDERMPGKEVMCWAHGRVGKNGKGVDTTLSLMSIPPLQCEKDDEEPISRLLLHSRLNSHLTFYTSSSSESTPIQSLLDPYSLDSPVQSIDKNWIRSGLSVSSVFKDDTEEQEGWIIMETGTKGDVYSRFVSVDSEDRTVLEEKLEQDEVMLPSRFEWPSEIEEIELEIEIRKQVLGVPFETPTKILDLRIPHQNVFGPPIAEEELEEASLMEPENAEENEGIKVQKQKKYLEKLVNADVNSQLDLDSEDTGTLTGFELAVHASRTISQAIDLSDDSEDDNTAVILPLPRAPTFLSSHSPSIHSYKTPQSIKTLGILVESIKASTPWSTSLHQSDPTNRKAFQKAMPDLCDFVQLPEAAEEMARKYSGESESNPLPAAACKQVLLDLSLASEIFSTRAMEPAPLSENQLNSPLPIDHPRPAHHFSYFRPRPSPDLEKLEESRLVGTGSRKRTLLRPSLESAGPRSLLSEWHLGSDPISYAWENPYAGEKKKKKDSDDEDREEEVPKRTKKKIKAKKKDQEEEDHPPLSSQFGFGTQSFPSSFDAHRVQTILEEPEPTPPSTSNGNAIASGSREPFGFASQPNLLPLPVQESSQDTQSQDRRLSGASQIVPGAFGGRVEKKKVKKKRISGF